MERYKRLTIVLIALLIAFLPLSTVTQYCYADNNNSHSGSGGYAWTNPSNDDEIVAAFKAYVSSRNARMEHVPNTIKNIVSWDINTLQNEAEALNIDLTTLNAKMWYCIDQNDKLRFFFESPVLRALNQIYGKVLEDNQIQYNSDKEIYSGEWFEDIGGNGCYIFYTNGNGAGSSYFKDSDSNPQITKFGSIYKYSGSVLWTNFSNPIYFSIHSIDDTSANLTKSSNWGVNQIYAASDTYSRLYYSDSSETFIKGFTCIYKDTRGRYYLGTYCRTKKNNEYYNYYSTRLGSLSLAPTAAKVQFYQGDQNIEPEDKSLEVQTDDNNINNYITNNNSTTINNYYDDDEPPQPNNKIHLPTTPNYPSGGTINPDGSINWTMPDLDIDFNLDFDLSDVFPFSIPFDIIDFFETFESEPVAPHIQGTIDLGVINYDVDIDLSYFDDVAAYIRTFILALYVFGLILATRQMFHIY